VTVKIYLLIFLCRVASRKVHGDFAELFERGFDVLDDFLGKNIETGKIVGFPEAFVSNRGNGRRPGNTV
jgi:hypothetical protein